MPKKYYMHGTLISEEEYLQLFKQSGLSEKDFLDQSGITSEEEEAPLDYNPEKTNVENDSLDNYQVGIEDFARVNEDGKVLESYSEEDMEKALRKKLNLIGLDVEQVGLNPFSDNIRIKPYIDPREGYLPDNLTPGGIGMDYIAERSLSMDLSLNKDNVQDNIKKLNEFINKYGNLEHLNQQIDLDAKDAKENDTDTVMNRAMEHSKVEDKRTLEDIRDEEITMFEDLSKRENITNVGGDAMDRKIGINLKGAKVNIKDFNGNEAQFNRYKQWKKGETIDPITTSEIEANRKAYEESERQKKFSEFASDLSGKERRRAELFGYKIEKEYKEGVDSIVELDKKYQQDAVNFKADLDAYNANPTEQGFYDVYEKQLDIIKQENKLEDLFRKIEADSKSAPLALENFAKNHNRFQQLMSGFKGVGAQIAYTAGYASMFNSPISGAALSSEHVRDAYMTPFTDLKEDIGKEQQGYQYSLRVDEIRTMKDAGRWLASSTVNLIPSLSVAFTGPAALPLFFAMGFGEAHGSSEIDQRNAAKSLPGLTKRLEAATDPFDKQMIQQEIDEAKRILDIPEWKQIGVGAAHGIAEVVFERFGTMALIKQARRGIKALPPKTKLEGFIWAGKTMFKGNLREGGSEFGTTVMQNIADNIFVDNKNIFDGTFEGGLESFAQGALMGGGISSISGMKMIRHTWRSEMATKADRDRLEEIRDKIAKLADVDIHAVDFALTGKITDGRTKDHKAVINKIQELTNESEAISQQIFARMGKDLSLEQIKEVGELNRQMREINKEWTQAVQLQANGDISIKQLREIENDLRPKFDKIADSRESVLTNAEVSKENIKKNVQVAWNQHFQQLSDAGHVWTAGGKGITRAESNIINEYENQTDKQKQALADKKLNEIYTKEQLEAAEKSPELLKKYKDKAAETAKKDYIDNRVKEKINQGIDNSKKFAEDVGENPADIFTEFDGDNAANEMAKAWLKLQEKSYQQLTAKEKADYKKIKNGEVNGLEDKGKILINKDAALKNRKIGIGSHEFLHYYAKKLAGETQGSNAQRALLEKLKESQPNLYILVKKLLDTNYAAEDADGNVIKDTDGNVVEGPKYNSEIINVISDVLSDGSVKVETSAFQDIKNFFKSLFGGKIQTDNIFKEGNEDALLNFVREYNNKAQFGKKDLAVSATLTRTPRKQDEDEKLDTNFSITNNTTVKQKNDLFSKTNKTFQETVDMFGKPWDQLTKDEKLVVGFQVGENWNQWAYSQMESQFGQVPGWGEYGRAMSETLSTGVETNDNGIPYIVSTWTEGGGRTLTSHIWGLLNERAKHVVQLPKFAGFGKVRVVDAETGQFDFERFDADQGGIPINTELDTKIDKTGEFRGLLSVNKGGKLYKKVLKVAKSNLSKNRELLDNPKAYRQALKIEFEKELDKEVVKLIGTQKSQEFKDFIGDVDNVKTLVALLGRKYRNRFPIFSTHGGTMKTGISVANQTSMKGSFVTNTKGGNDIWILKDLDAMNETELKDYIQQVADFFIKGRETQHKSLKKALSNELGLDAAHQVLRNSTNLSNQYEGVIGQVTEAIKREPDTNFSRTINNLDVTNRAIWEINKEEFLSKLDAKGFSKEQIRKAWNATEGLSLIPKTEATKIINDFARILKPFEKELPDVVFDKSDLTAAEYLNIAIDNFDLGQDLKTMLKLEKTPGHYFNTLEGIQEFERFNEDLIVAYAEKIGDPVKAADMFIKFYMATVKNSGKTGSGIWSKKSGIWKKSGRGGENRHNLYESTEHFAELIRIIDPSIGLKGDKNKYFVRNGKRIDITKPTQKTIDYVNGKIDRKARKKAAKEAQDFIKEIMPLAKKIAKSNISLGMLMQGMGSNMNTVLRSAADLKYVPEFMKSTKSSFYRYEHMIPARVISMYLVDHYFNGNKDVDIDKLFSTYNVAIVPKTMDEAVSEIFNRNMNIGWRPGDPPHSRYYNQFTIGRPSVAIKDLDNGDVFGKFHENVYNAVQDGKIATKEGLKFQEDINTSFSISKSVPKGITVLDLDDTLITSKSEVLAKMPDGTLRRFSPSQFALQHQSLEEQGAEFDFSEFEKVIGGKTAPLFQKALKLKNKFGTKDMFVLTARPADAAPAIHAFLKANGLNIPLKNIIGLEDGRPQAKAAWIADKVANGYNDFYFADDILQNVEAVKDLLEQFDVKSKVQQARVDYNLSLSKKLNDIIEENKGIRSEAEFSDVVAQRRGEKANPWTFYLPSHAEDMKGLIYTILGKGKKGDEQLAFFKRTILDPYHRGIANIKVAKQQLTNYYKELVKSHGISKNLKKLTPDGDFTNDHAVRVYLYSKSGWEVPGISKRDQAKLIKHVENNPKLLAFASDLISLPQLNGKYIKPSLHWDASSIVGDLDALSNKIGRKAFLKEFIDNKNEMFNKANMNKLKALYGTNFTEALEDMLYRMENGTNRSFGKNRLVNGFMNWINNSVGAVMFINMRSAILQTISMVNFVNWTDNNPIKAAIAFGNQPQYWKDFATIFNSDKLKQRRSGLQINVQEQELANAVKNSRNKANAALSWLLKKGFLPTQIADSFAIASGGATMYRNRINTYLKQVNPETKKLYTKAEAEAKAWEDFSDIAEETQQSGDPALISQIQASPLGRVLFAWQNTPFQYNRLMKRAGQDLINRRRNPGQTQLQSDMSNISKIIYYGAVQNFIFNALQSALFAMLPGFGGDEDEDQIKQNEKDLKRQIRVANNMLDTILRGSGLPGAIVSTIKNIIMEYSKQEKKGYTADHTYTMLQTINLSPPLGSKARKVYGAIQTHRFEKDVIAERGFAPDSPIYEIMGKLVSASLNVPLDRLVSKTQNMTAALDERNEAWQRIATALGWATYDVGVEPYPFHQEIKDAAKEKRVELGKIKAKETRKKKAEIKKNIIREIMADDNLRKEYYNIPSKERNKYVDKLVKERLNK